MSGGGTLAFSSANSYTGTTTIINGTTLKVSGDVDLGPDPTIATPGNIVLNGGTLQATANVVLGANRGIALGPSSSQGTISVTTNNTLFYNGIVANNGPGHDSLTVSGGGTLELGGANTYDRGTTITGGATLSVSSDSNLGSVNPGNIVLNGGTLEASAGFALNSKRGIALGPQSASGIGTIEVAAGTLSFAGSLANNGSGTGGLTLIGPGTLALSGFNPYNGATTISTGTLEIDTGGSLGRGVVTNNSSLVFNRRDSSTVPNTIGGSGTVSMEGGGVVTLSGNNTYSGGTTISFGELNIKSYDALGTGPVALIDASTSTNNTILLATFGGTTAIPNDITVANQGKGTSVLGTTAVSGSSPTVFAGSVTLDDHATFQGGNLNGTDWDGVISSPNGPVNVQVTSGNLTSFGPNTNFAGSVDISGNGTTLQASGPVAGFGGSGLGWTVNQSGTYSSSTAISGDVLTLTDGNGSEARSPSTTPRCRRRPVSQQVSPTRPHQVASPTTRLTERRSCCKDRLPEPVPSVGRAAAWESPVSAGLAWL